MEDYNHNTVYSSNALGTGGNTPTSPGINKTPGEIMQEIQRNTLLIDELSAAFSMLANKLDPLLPAPILADSKVAETPPRQSSLARRLDENNVSLSQTIQYIHQLRSDLQI